MFTRVGSAPTTNALFDQVLGPFPAHVEPFSLVPRDGLEEVLAELRLGPGDHLVDLCCGRGGIGLWFASESGARLTGVDFSPVAVAEARRRASFIAADAAHTSLAAGTVDAVVCIDALQLVTDRDGLLQEVGRLLRAGGRAVITTWERRGNEPERLPADVRGLVAADGAHAEPALHALAEEGRTFLANVSRVRRILVVAESRQTGT